MAQGHAAFEATESAFGPWIDAVIYLQCLVETLRIFLRESASEDFLDVPCLTTF
jgi:hypothetical protein